MRDKHEDYYSKQVERSGELPEVSLDFEIPDAEVIRRQWDYARWYRETSEHGDCLIAIIEHGRFIQVHSFDELALPERKLPGSWAIVNAVSSFHGKDHFIHASSCAMSIAKALVDCGLVPEGIDKFLVTDHWRVDPGFIQPPDDMSPAVIPMLYSESSLHEAMIPRECVRIEKSEYGDLYEKLNPTAGGVEILAKPSPEAQPLIDEHYRNKLIERYAKGFKQRLSSVVPMFGNTGQHPYPTRESNVSAEFLLEVEKALSDDEDSLLKTSFPTRTGGAAIDMENYKNEYPMSDEFAEKLVSYRYERERQSRACLSVWRNRLDEYGLASLKPLCPAVRLRPLEDVTSSIELAKELLDIAPYERALNSGVSWEDLFASGDNVSGH